MTRTAPELDVAVGPAPLERRAALTALLGAAAALGACKGDGGASLPATEDLMREHGLLRRIFGVYDEVARRARSGEAFDPSVVARAARIMRTFGEDYHERAEERWVFPVVRRDASHAALVDTLKVQHDRGRAVTDAIAQLAAQGPAPRSEAAAQLASQCEAFNRMYRPHAAIEDTVVFPALRADLSRKAFHEVGERMEDAERSTLGDRGFERALAEVAGLERALGLDELARFTPAAPR